MSQWFTSVWYNASTFEAVSYLVVQGIKLLRPIDGDDCHGVGDFELDCVLGERVI